MTNERADRMKPKTLTNRRGRPRQFTAAEIAHIREMYQRPGVSAPDIARLYRVSPTTILRAVEGRLRAIDE